jgi:hypothetical protein
MYDDDDFFAITKFLKLGIKIQVKNPMGQNSSFATSFPTPKGGTASFDEKTLYDLERKLRSLIQSDIPVRTKLAPFDYLGTNFRGMIFLQKAVNEFILQETHDLFGMESKKVVRKAEHFFQLLK